MKNIFVFAILFCSASYASTIQTSIHEIDLGNQQNDEALVFSNVDGKIYRIRNPIAAHKLVNALILAKETKQSVTLEINSKNEITSAKLIAVDTANTKNLKLIQPDDIHPNTAQPEEYIPTVISDRALLNKYLAEMTNDAKFYTRSQCFRRAEIWAYDLYQYDKVNSMKVIVFYTTKYIREYRFDWWFHIAPFIYFLKDGVKYEVVLDKTFFPDGGVEISDWASAFMKNGAKCAEVAKYQDYEAGQEKADCYVRKFPMYYYNPEQVEKLDKENVVKTAFDLSDIADAGSQMFRRKW